MFLWNSQHSHGFIKLLNVHLAISLAILDFAVEKFPSFIKNLLWEKSRRRSLLGKRKFVEKDRKGIYLSEYIMVETKV